MVNANNGLKIKKKYLEIIFYSIVYMVLYKSKKVIKTFFQNSRKPATKKSMVKLIKSVVLKQAETKTTQQSIGQTFGTVLQSSILNVKPIGPSSAYMPITQSTGQDGRIGNQIKVKKATMRYVLLPSAYNAVSNPTPTPLEVIIWIDV